MDNEHIKQLVKEQAKFTFWLMVVFALGWIITDTFFRGASIVDAFYSGLLFAIGCSVTAAYINKKIK